MTQYWQEQLSAMPYMSSTCTLILSFLVYLLDKLLDVDSHLELLLNLANRLAVHFEFPSEYV